MTCTLNELKDKISGTEMGPIERCHQRLFYLGRELKSGRRTLSALGIGRYPNFLIHLHSTKPATLELSSDDDEIVMERVVKPKERKRKENEASTSHHQPIVVDLLDDDNDDEGNVIELLSPTTNSQDDPSSKRLRSR